MSKKRKHRSIKPQVDQSTINNTIFDNTRQKTTYIRQVVSSGISLRQAASPKHNILLCFMNPQIEDLVPRCYRTVTNQINTKFLERKASIIRSITNAKGEVTISFNRQKANNDVLDLLRVVIHYLRDDYKVHNVVLAIRNTLSSYTGANIVDQLFDVLKDYQISRSQIAFFIANNATNNEKALQHLVERITLNPVESRLRCTSYVFNLVYTAVLFGVNEYALDNTQYNFL